MWYDAESWDEMASGLKLYRGFSRKVPEASVQVASPEDRRPAKMPPKAQRQIDDEFERMFGIRFRQRSLFTTGNLEIAKQYAGDWGEVRTVRPIARFTFCWSNSSIDLYDKFQSAQKNESIADLLLRLQFECGRLADAVASGHEIMMVGTAFEANLLEAGEA